MENKAVAFIKSNEWFKSTMVEHGTHNGYVAVPSANKYHGMSYFDIDDSKYVGKRNPILDDVEFITDNTEIGDDWWIFGFDTFHYGDNEYDWDKQAVVQETRYLMKQLDK